MRLAVLASGSGAIFEAIATRTPVSLLLADRDCRALTIARERGIKAVHVRRQSLRDPAFDRTAYTRAIVGVLRRKRIDLVAMAGFMTILDPCLHEALPGRVLNTHAALLPAFPGPHPVRDALASGVAVSGCTVHIATADVDAGPILAQEDAPVFADDTEEVLHERIKAIERRLYPEVIAAFAASLRTSN
ncbi:MAG: phosphoribosylglycinamide formyltransferase [Chloroflexi bacterium]|nr:phosphoribosylglycinamide formyltransferase [Chloroflexota bacterium]